MGFNPANLAFRFVLEVVSLVGLFRLGLELGSGFWRWILAIVITFIGMALWANYRVPGDQSAKGTAPFAVSGVTRLAIEMLVFGVGAVGWFLSGPSWVAYTFLGGLVLHYLLSYDRIGWLMRVNSDGEPVFSDSR